MDNYITGTLIKKLRESRKMTQEELADKVCVSSKAVSKWETGRGFPDIGLIESLAKALDISVIELLSGIDIRNRNRSADMKKCKFYVCPVCGNAIQATGEAVITCCGITLPPLEAEIPDPDHTISLEVVEDEYYVTVDHPMTKTHYISFLAAVSDQNVQFTKLYPEGDAATRFKINRVERIYAYCNHHGLFVLNLKRGRIPTT
ncbi:MAG: helix-turn-helix domain-containing protein [Spirochaetales bacterium]|nr:helix-turn-helix domain-containing protein [Spirochaetales bacterium]